MNGTNNMSARDSFELSRQMFWNAFRDKFSSGAKGDADCWGFVNSLKLSQSENRFEVGLDANNSKFTFGIIPTQANSDGIQYITENRLKLQDSLCVCEYGLFTGRGLNEAGDAADPLATEFDLLTYGNTQVYSAAAAAAIDGGFYSNGNLRVVCNGDVLIPYRGLFNHLYRPQTQQTAALGAASPKDQIRGVEDSALTMEPNLVLIGSKDYDISVNLKKSLSTVDVGTRAILIVRGILAQNSTTVS